jgi:hypothetical protein
LRPEENWAVRVLPLNEAGDAGNRIFALTFSTPAANPPGPRISLIQRLLLALAACFAIAIWRYLRPRKTEFM